MMSLDSSRILPNVSEIRQRHVHHVQIQEPKQVTRPKQRRHFRRIAQFQKNWKAIDKDLPAQLSRRHIGMISVGGVIGTGLFVGSADALKNGGPVGALLAYSVMGTVVYCLCVSVGEIISFLPNVGGVVGLADLYVDPALGFSLGWAAWYNWSITLPVEVTAAAIVVRYWDVCGQIPLAALTSIFLAAAVAVNLFPSRVYGELEFVFSTIKVCTIVIIILCTLLVDFGANQDRKFYGLDSWSQPFSRVPYLGIRGWQGRFLGFWAALMQAGFSFFGSEVPGIAAGEVIDATINVPRALKRVWRRITIFYVGSILVAGLILPSGEVDIDSNKQQKCTNKDFDSSDSPQGTGNSSPFVTIFREAGIKGLPDLVNAAILISAWSAAASDVYISSRFLFFLARQSHAPAFLGYLTSWRRRSTQLPESEMDQRDLSPTSFPMGPIHRALPGTAIAYPDTMTSDTEVASAHSDSESLSQPSESSEKSKDFILPLFSVIVSSSVGLLAFMTLRKGGPTQAFLWMGNVTSVASLQAWTGMLYTYIRMYRGSIYAERNGTDDDKEGIKRMKRHRHRGQPYLAYYAFTMCVIILLTNGWFVFVGHSWRIANQSDTPLPSESNSDRIPIFLSSYIPLPFFILITIGYKLVHQTRMVHFEKMTFGPYDVPEPEPLPPPTTWWQKIWYRLI